MSTIISFVEIVSIWRPSAVLHLFCASLDDTRRVFGGFYRATPYCHRVSVCPSGRHKPVLGVVSKRMDETSSVLAWRLPSTISTVCCKEILVSPKTVCQTLDLANFARQIDRVVNKTHRRGRRRRRSSLLTAPSRVA